MRSQSILEHRHHGPCHLSIPVRRLNSGFDCFDRLMRHIRYLPLKESLIRLLPGSHKLFVQIETQTAIFDLDSSSFVAGAEFVPPGVGRQTYPMQTGHVLLPQKEGDPPRILIVGGSTTSGFDYNTQTPPRYRAGSFSSSMRRRPPANSQWRATRNAPQVARLLADTVLLPNVRRQRHFGRGCGRTFRPLRDRHAD